MAGYKMPHVSKSGPAGLAKVQLGQKTGKVKVIVTYKVDGEEVTEEIVLDKENCPKWIASGLWRVKFSGDKKKLFAAIPANQQIVCQFKEFSHEEGQLPAPKEVTGGQYGPYMQFIMILVATDAPYEGMEIPVFMRYNFQPLEDGGRQIAALPTYKTAKHLKLLEDTLYALGILEDGPMPWKDNLLPLIQKRARKAVEDRGTKVLVTLQDGYVNAIAPVVDDWNEDEDEGIGLEGDDDEDDGEGAGEHDARKAPAKPQAKNAPVSEPDPDDDDPPFKVDDSKVDYSKAEDEGDDDIDWEG